MKKLHINPADIALAKLSGLDIRGVAERFEIPVRRAGKLLKSAAVIRLIDMAQDDNAAILASHLNRTIYQIVGGLDPVAIKKAKLSERVAALNRLLPLAAMMRGNRPREWEQHKEFPVAPVFPGDVKEETDPPSNSEDCGAPQSAEVTR